MNIILTSLKVLGVTVTEKLSFTEHVDDVINSCARSMYVISVLRSHGMCAPLLQQVFQSAKLTYAAPAWWGFSTSADRQSIKTFLRRAARSCLWEYATTVEELVDDADKRSFSKVWHCAHHVLEELLPPKSDSQHNLRKRRHNITLPEKKGHLAAKNFIIRLWYKDTY